jgi:hypothetical protein
MYSLEVMWQGEAGEDEEEEARHNVDDTKDLVKHLHAALSRLDSLVDVLSIALHTDYLRLVDVRRGRIGNIFFFFFFFFALLPFLLRFFYGFPLMCTHLLTQHQPNPTFKVVDASADDNDRLWLLRRRRTALAHLSERLFAAEALLGSALQAPAAAFVQLQQLAHKWRLFRVPVDSKTGDAVAVDFSGGLASGEVFTRAGVTLLPQPPYLAVEFPASFRDAECVVLVTAGTAVSCPLTPSALVQATQACSPAVQQLWRVYTTAAARALMQRIAREASGAPAWQAQVLSPTTVHAALARNAGDDAVFHLLLQPADAGARSVHCVLLSCFLDC